MNLSELTENEMIQLMEELKESEELQYVTSPSMLREYMDTLNPTIALIQAPIDIWKEVSRRWLQEKHDLIERIEAMKRRSESGKHDSPLQDFMNK